MVTPPPTISVSVSWSIISSASNLINSLLKSQVSMFLVGAQGTGKSSFVEAIKNSEISIIENMAMTAGHIETRRPVPMLKAIIPLVVHDFGGHATYHTLRCAKLAEIRPLGILWFLDHRDTRKDLTDTGKTSGTLDPARINEHRIAAQELVNCLRLNPKAARYCRAIMPVLNKWDLWGKNDQVGNVITSSFTHEINDLMSLNLSLLPSTPCSTVTRYGVESVLAQMVHILGREIPVAFKWKIRLRSSFL